MTDQYLKLKLNDLHDKLTWDNRLESVSNDDFISFITLGAEVEGFDCLAAVSISISPIYNATGIVGSKVSICEEIEIALIRTRATDERGFLTSNRKVIDTGYTDQLRAKYTPALIKEINDKAKLQVIETLIREVKDLQETTP